MGFRLRANKSWMPARAFVAGLSLLSGLLRVAAMPIDISNSTDLYEAGPSGLGFNVWVSNVTTIIFGEDATDFDFHITGEAIGAIESIATFAAVFPTGDADATLVAFLNTTMSGTMMADQATDMSWLCGELSGDMASMSPACEGVVLAGSTLQPSASVDKHTAKTDQSLYTKRSGRGRFGWIATAAHVSSKFAMEVLQRSLESKVYQSFDTNPRSWCTAVNGVTACISWSKAEVWNHNYAIQMMNDALTSVDFDHYSAQANGVLGTKKRSGADVCLSNRADGCT